MEVTAGSMLLLQHWNYVQATIQPKLRGTQKRCNHTWRRAYPSRKSLHSQKKRGRLYKTLSRQNKQSCTALVDCLSATQKRWFCAAHVGSGFTKSAKTSRTVHSTALFYCSTATLYPSSSVSTVITACGTTHDNSILGSRGSLL